MGTFLYFAYGSNMLTERLSASKRCPSAKPVGIAYAPGHTLTFTKKSLDLSGKATLTEAKDSRQHGVLFEIDYSEVPDLDREEGCSSGYGRNDTFPVVRPDGEQIKAVTYLASKPEPGLTPYDWYLALIVAGAKQHELPAAQIEALRSIAYDNADKNQRAINGRRDAVAALSKAGFDSPSSVLDQRAM